MGDCKCATGQAGDPLMDLFVLKLRILTSELILFTKIDRRGNAKKVKWTLSSGSSSSDGSGSDSDSSGDTAQQKQETKSESDMSMSSEEEEGEEEEEDFNPFGDGSDSDDGKIYLIYLYIVG